MTRDTTSEAFFEEMYRKDGDPWSFAKSEYELSRYDSVIRFLGGRTFRRAFEPGCSIGVLTEKLASRCESLEAMDFSSTAVLQAKERCAHLANVTVLRGAIPEDLPSKSFDLIIFSEIGYYFASKDLRDIAIELANRLEVGGLLLAAHWLGYSADHLLSGDQVHEVLTGVPGLVCLRSERNVEFRMNSWSRA